MISSSLEACRNSSSLEACRNSSSLEACRNSSSLEACRKFPLVCARHLQAFFRPVSAVCPLLLGRDPAVMCHLHTWGGG
ncbi:MAG TPA: hypothetical protein PLN32_02825 [Methanoregulaceae archaeon]|nr:hypothetical protein [Methanoregulaceae archaeon]